MTAAGPAPAQNIDCVGIRAQIAALNRGDPARAAPYQRAAARQRAEIDRTVAYGHSIGCDRQQFLFFGSAPPPQCGRINAQIGRMTANLQALEQSAAQAGGGNEDLRRDLTQRYNTYCGSGASTVSVAPPRQRGLLDFLFSGDSPPPDAHYQQLPLDPDQPAAEAPPPEDARQAQGGPKAVCVRTCDGSFFPVSYSARRDQLDDLGEMCRALCPNAEVALYTYSIWRDIGSAVSVDGTPYSELPNAFKFTKSYDPSCTCRPPGKSWAETLAEAERMLRTRKTDVIVTPEQADLLSRPRPPGKPKPARTAGVRIPDLDKPLPSPPVDDATTADGVMGAQVPTASRESAGITPGTTTAGSVYGAGQGETREVIGPDGVKRRVRIVAPTL